MHCKGNDLKIKSQPMELEKIFENHMSDKEGVNIQKRVELV